MSQNVLHKTKCTVIGPMQFADGTGIRDYFKAGLEPIGVTIFDHYHNPFVMGRIKEDKEVQLNLKKMMEEERYEEVEEYKSIRTFDLALIDKSDFLIVDFVPNITMCGTWEEFFWANRMKKPIFFISEIDKRLTPHWVFWTIGHKYVYRCKEEVLDCLLKIDSGEIEIDSDRWKLLKPELR